MTQPQQQQPQKSYNNPAAKPPEANKGGVQFRPGQDHDDPSRKGAKPEEKPQEEDNDNSSR